MLPTTLLADKKKWTYEEYYLLGEDVHCQVLQGELIMTPAPSLNHQRISRNLGLELWRFVQEKGLGEVLYAPVDVVLDDENVVQPDLVFVAQANAAVLQHRGIMGSPDLVVEIVSPSSLHQDRYQKKMLYERAGVREYWLVDPANRSVEIFALADGKYSLACWGAEQGTVASKLLAGFSVEIGKIMPQMQQEK